MATQTTTSTEQNQSPQGQVTRGSQQQGASPRRQGYALGLPITSAEFFRMNPFALMRRVTEELDRALTEAPGREQGNRAAWAPAVDVTQRDGNLLVRAELPGVPPDAIRLEVMDDMIVIQGERKAEHEETRGGIHVMERRYGAFYRAIPLPEGAKADEIRARFENGVLEITVPTEERRSSPREIPIQQGAQSSQSAHGSQGSQGTTGTSATNQGPSSESATGSGRAA